MLKLIFFLNGKSFATLFLLFDCLWFSTYFHVSRYIVKNFSDCDTCNRQVADNGVKC